METEQMKPYSVKETIKSQLNIHIYNSSGRKKRFFVSILLNKDVSEDIFPKEHKDWVLEEAGARRKGSGTFLNYAYYIRDMSESEVQTAILEEELDDPDNYQELA